jgi:UV DNA damage endonuclease
MRIGYPCMNRTLREGEPVRCNRSMQQATFEERGLEYASELTRQNFEDLRRILEWNVENGISFYRCTSELVPWHSQFELEDLPDCQAIEAIAADCGALIRESGMRFTFHPSHWVKIAGPDEDTVARGVTDLENHGAWLDLLGLDRSPFYSINVHIGATYGDKAATAARFRDVVSDMAPAASERLTVENDDTESLWSVPELVESVGDVVPVVFDYHHHKFTDRGYTYREAFEMARETWPTRPVVHYSEAKRLHEGTDAQPKAHSAYVQRVPDWLVRHADVMLEAGAKERAVLELQTLTRQTPT